MLSGSKKNCEHYLHEMDDSKATQPWLFMSPFMGNLKSLINNFFWSITLHKVKFNNISMHEIMCSDLKL